MTRTRATAKPSPHLGRWRSVRWRVAKLWSVCRLGSCTLLVTTRGRLFRFGSTTGGPWQLKQESSFQTVPTLVEALARHRVTGVAGGQFHVVICTHDGEVFTYGGD